jgi:hypothetical protein
MNKCLSCGNALEQKDGKREKKFCNNTCRSSYWFKQNKVPKVKTVPIEEWNELQNKLKKLEELKGATITDLNKQSKKVKNLTEEKPKTNYTIDTKNKKEEMPSGLSLSEQLEWRANH